MVIRALFEKLFKSFFEGVFGGLFKCQVTATTGPYDQKFGGIALHARFPLLGFISLTLRNYSGDYSEAPAILFFLNLEKVLREVP